jgi:peptidoglycan/xylan/chitin deacetylase (PgdA/CDA1 family)
MTNSNMYINSNLQKLKYAIKWGIAYTLFYSGILNAYRWLYCKGNVIVLMYHRVLPDLIAQQSFSHEGIIVKAHTFEKQIKFLNKKFRPLSIDEFSENLINKRTFYGYSCLITFDDGWADNYSEAYPILNRYSTPATIFLPIDYIGTKRRFWQEELAELVYRLYQIGPRAIKILEKYQLTSLHERSDSDVRKMIKTFVNQLKSRSSDEINEIINEINLYLYSIDNVNVMDNVDQFMSWDEILEMDRNNISFGSHSKSHSIMTQLSLEDVETELETSKHTIQSVLGHSIISFAYPNGNFNKNIAHLLKASGYEIAFTTVPGRVVDSDDTYSIKRINIHEDTTRNIPMFYCHILGIF